MKRQLFILISFIYTITAIAQKQTFVTSDIDNFWTAYEKIRSTKDSIEQYRLLKELYTSKASAGLKGLIEVRNYSEKEFIDAINSYPLFWQSIKPNILNARESFSSIQTHISKLKELYPNLKPATIYFSVGAFRTNGTVQGNKILLGCELALADSSTNIDELPGWRKPFYKEYNPKENIALLCTHEYIHTQQNEFVENLLSMCLYEGIAEFISCTATGKKSNCPAIGYGKLNQQKIVNKFIEDLFTMNNNYNWLWGENRNELKVRDIGYYIGYEISERYYNSSKDKVKAITDLIELDYTNEKDVERIVDATNLFPKYLKIYTRLMKKVARQ